MPMTAAVQARPVSGPEGELVMVMCSFQAGNPPAGRLAGHWRCGGRRATFTARRSACGGDRGRGDGLDHAGAGEGRADPAVQVVAAVMLGARAAYDQPCLVLGQARVVEVGVVVADQETDGEAVTGPQRPDPGLVLTAVARVDHDGAARVAGGDAAERMAGLPATGSGVAVVDGDDGGFQGDGVDLLVPGRRMQAVQAAFQPVLPRAAGIARRVVTEDEVISVPDGAHILGCQAHQRFTPSCRRRDGKGPPAGMPAAPGDGSGQAATCPVPSASCGPLSGTAGCASLPSRSTAPGSASLPSSSPVQGSALPP